MLKTVYLIVAVKLECPDGSEQVAAEVVGERCSATVTQPDDSCFRFSRAEVIVALNDIPAGISR